MTMLRRHLLAQFLTPDSTGRRPEPIVIVDFTTCTKEVRLKHFCRLLHYFHDCFGLYGVVLYL
ncbi:hypothetical protein KR51_00006450 [Rubidibacter lacunae KORDI 51-2]|uniref:Uncharacterized protein n=1 Tax=Rubidibacter lacunae KORDI 51-2 TaxID=582515 RepID=U5DLW5_9CHRO|nr:hypothetical protein KR51_00006450 [Rubidibacter lacunae KORDI 51-2]